MNTLDEPRVLPGKTVKANMRDWAKKSGKIARRVPKGACAHDGDGGLSVFDTRSVAAGSECPGGVVVRPAEVRWNRDGGQADGGWLAGHDGRMGFTLSHGCPFVPTCRGDPASLVLAMWRRCSAPAWPLCAGIGGGGGGGEGPCVCMQCRHIWSVPSVLAGIPAPCPPTPQASPGEVCAVPDTRRLSRCPSDYLPSPTATHPRLFKGVFIRRALPVLSPTSAPLVGYRDVLMPDPGFSRWGKAVPGMLAAAREPASQWGRKAPRVFWRGTSTGSDITSESADANPRVRLARFGRAHPEAVDAQFTGLVQVNGSE